MWCSARPCAQMLVLGRIKAIGKAAPSRMPFRTELPSRAALPVIEARAEDVLRRQEDGLLKYAAPDLGEAKPPHERFWAVLHRKIGAQVRGAGGAR